MGNVRRELPKRKGLRFAKDNTPGLLMPFDVFQLQKLNAAKGAFYPFASISARDSSHFSCGLFPDSNGGDWMPHSNQPATTMPKRLDAFTERSKKFLIFFEGGDR